MDFKEKVAGLLQEALVQKPALFLIELSIQESGAISVTLDGDQGVSLQDCMDVSRAIEHNLDREEKDFSLEVASAGVGSPLQHIRQYKKNIGRQLQVTTLLGVKHQAELVSADDIHIGLSWTSREPKKIGKGKETVKHLLQIPYQEIKQAIVTITF